MERGNAVRSREQEASRSFGGLGRAALEGAETAKAADRSRDLGRKTLATASRPEPFTLDIGQFDTPALAGLYPHKEIVFDRRYVEDARKYFESKFLSQSEFQAKNFETMLLYGIQRNAWLGNTLNVFGQPPFTTETSASTEYDDIKHCIDAFTTLHFANAQPNEDHQACLTRVVLGFDATVSSNRKTIMEKLTKCSNDRQAELPFGFSQIKYYVDGRVASKQLLVPRYTVGVGVNHVQDLRKMAHIERQGGKIVNMRFNGGQSNMVRFMVLSEISAQNELYRAMLPDELDTPLLKKADMSLSLITKQLNTALDQCIDRMSHIKWLVKDQEIIPQDVHTPEERDKLRHVIEQRIIERCKQDYSEYLKEVDKRKKHGFIDSSYRPDPDFQDTFVQIMQCSRELTKAAKDGRLDTHRTVSAHTSAFDIPGKKIQTK